MDLEKLKGLEKEEIKNQLLESVIKTEEEIEKEKTEKKSKSDLKIFLVKSSNLTPDELEDSIYDLLESDDIPHYLQKFLEAHNFEISPLIEEAFGLTIFTPEFNKEDSFVIFQEKEYWHIWTTARRHWTKKTIEKLIDNHPRLERIFVNPEELEKITRMKLQDELGENSRFSGFVAKKKPFYSEKQISINMYGGDYDDLEKVKEDFNAEPTQITISMKNSPVNCVLGHLHGSEGYISLSTILEDYFDWGSDIAEMSSSLFEESDREIYEIEELPIEINKGENGVGYTIFQSYHALELQPQFEENRTPDMISKIFEKALEWFLEKKQGYYGYEWDENTYHILQKENMDLFQLSKESDNLVLYPLDRCSEKTIKDVSKQIVENITEDIQPKPYHNKPAART